MCILFLARAWCELALIGNSIETNVVTTVVEVEPEQIGASFISIMIADRSNRNASKRLSFFDKIHLKVF